MACLVREIKGKAVLGINDHPAIQLARRSFAQASG